MHSPWALALMFGVFLGSYSNSQIHKWAREQRPPRFVRALQRLHFFLAGAPRAASRRHARGALLHHHRLDEPRARPAALLRTLELVLSWLSVQVDFGSDSGALARTQLHTLG
jgi:hypothetical protein